MACHVFISYRRKDSNAWAGRIFDRLAQIFPAKSVFIDIDGIEPGLDFVRTLNDHLATCKVMLVVIGPNWLSTTDAQGRRLIDEPLDYVKAEIKAALERNIRVIPVLIDGARMPSESDLPPQLRPLAWRQAVELSHARFTADSEVLVESVTRAALNEFPEQAARLQAPIAHLGGDHVGSPRQHFRFGLRPSIVLGTTLVGLFIALGGVIVEVVIGPKLYLVSELSILDQPIDVPREHQPRPPSPSEAILTSLSDAIFDARWFIFCGVGLALCAAVVAQRDWRLSWRGARIVTSIGAAACLVAVAIWGSAGVVSKNRPPYDPEKIGANFSGMGNGSDWIRLFKYPKFLESVEFAAMLSGALALVAFAFAIYHLRYVGRRVPEIESPETERPAR